MGVGDGQGVEVCRGDAEVLREQLRGVGEAGSTRGSTQPMIIVFIDGMIFRSAEKRLLAKASLRWVRVSITVIGMFVSPKKRDQFHLIT